MSRIVTIEADITAAEARALGIATETLNRLLRESSDDAPRLVWRADAERDSSTSAGVIHLVSFLSELEASPRSWAEHEQAIRGKVAALSDAAQGPIFIMTIFRHAPETSDPEHLARRRLIRRLNYLSLDLSRELGVFVIDVDRFIADIGGFTAQTDYRLEGERAALLVGFVLARVLLTDALCDHAPAQAIDDMARKLEAQRLVFKDESIDWPEFVPNQWIDRRARGAHTHVATVYDDFDPNFVASMLKNFMQGKVPMLIAIKAVLVSAGRHGVKATARRLWNGAAQFRKLNSP